MLDVRPHRSTLASIAPVAVIATVCLIAAGGSLHAARASLSADVEPIKVWYWPYVGRAGCIFRMLEEAQYPYEHISSVWSIAGMASALGATSGDTFAPPIIQDGERILSQSTAICMYLGEKLGYADGVPNKYKAMQHMNDLLDAFDGVSIAAGDTEALHKFTEGGRLDAFFGNIERSIVGPYFYGEKMTYVDFYLLMAFDYIPDSIYDRLHGFDFHAIMSKYPKISEVFTRMRALDSYNNIELPVSISHSLLSPRTVTNEVIANY